MDQTPTTSPMGWSALLLGFRAGEWWSIENLNCAEIPRCEDVHLSPHSSFRTPKTFGFLALCQLFAVSLTGDNTSVCTSVKFAANVSGSIRSFYANTIYTNSTDIGLPEAVSTAIQTAPDGWFRSLRDGISGLNHIHVQSASSTVLYGRNNYSLPPEVHKLFTFVSEVNLCI